MALELKFGKKAAFHDPRTLKLASYLLPELPAPPDEYSSLDRIGQNLGVEDPVSLFPIDGNDTKGDCTIAGAAHLVTNWRGLIGLNYVPPEADVIAKYNEMTGGVDEGLVLLDVLKYWKKYGLFGDKIGAFVSVNFHDPIHVMQAIYLFGGVYTGFIVQENCIRDFQNGTPWTAGPPDPEGGGHCVSGLGKKNGLWQFATWGGIQNADDLWRNSCVDEMFATVPPEMLDQKFIPGFDVQKLQHDMIALSH